MHVLPPCRRRAEQAPHVAPCRRCGGDRGAARRGGLRRAVEPAVPPALAERDRRASSRSRWPTLRSRRTSPSRPTTSARAPSRRTAATRSPDASRSLGNDDVRLAFVTATDTSPLYRNAVGDELVYVQSGAGAAGERVRPARRRRRRLRRRPEPASPTDGWSATTRSTLLVVESRAHITVPRRYLTATGQLLEGAPFSERDLRAPDAEPLLVEGDDVAVLVRTAPAGPRHVHATTRSTSSAGTGACTRGRSPSTTSSRSSGASTSHRRCTRRSPAPGFVVCSFVPRLVRLRPRRGEGAVPPRQRRLRRDAVLHATATS